MVTTLVVALTTPTVNSDTTNTNVNSQQISLQRDSGVVRITRPGNYTVSGSVNDGGLVVNVDDGTVTITLDGAKIVNNYGPAISIEKAGGTVNVVARENTNNYLTNGLFGDDTGAVIYSYGSLGISGSGALYLNARHGEGIVTKGHLEVTDTTIVINGAFHNPNSTTEVNEIKDLPLDEGDL